MRTPPFLNVVVTGFTVAPGGGKAIEAAADTFYADADSWAEVHARRKEAKRALKAVEGSPSEEADAQAALVEIDREFRAAEAAVDASGNALLRAIADGREKWQQRTRREVETRYAELQQALKEARKASNALQSARGIAAWLARFEISDNPGGYVTTKSTQFPGGPALTVELGQSVISSQAVPVTALLDACATLTLEPETPEPRHLTTAVASSGRGIA